MTQFFPHWSTQTTAQRATDILIVANFALFCLSWWNGWL